MWGKFSNLIGWDFSKVFLVGLGLYLILFWILDLSVVLLL